jgi:thiamine-phosphate pyrophosphorylase
LWTICAARRIKLLIADDPALALRLRADGVHLPQRRAAKVGALKALHPRWLVTAAAHDKPSAGAASRLGADAILIAPVFPTASHPKRETFGVVRLAAIAGKARALAYALGGVDAVTVQRLMATPLRGIALISGWIQP